MNAHRLNYTPAPAVQPSRFTGLLAIAALGAGTAGIGIFVAMILHAGTPAHSAPQPVRTPDVQVFPVEPIDGPTLAAIRAEAFRAGVAEGLAQGSCRGVAALSAPIGEGRR